MIKSEFDRGSSISTAASVKSFGAYLLAIFAMIFVGKNDPPAIDIDVKESTKSAEKEKIEVIADTEEKIKEEYPDVRYWSVERDNNKIYIVKPITYEEALLLADLNKNILCVDHAAAQEIAKNYPDAFICHDKNNDNYLYHYHLNQKHKNHIWFFGPPI